MSMDRATGSYVEVGQAASPLGSAAAVPTAIAENIEQLIERQKTEQIRRGWQLRLADAITAFSGSMFFVWLHVLWFGGWVAVNTGLVPGVRVFDAYPFGLLTMVVSLEAIFLATFVLISQNRMQLTADKRAELDLHVNLLAEREATEILRKLARIEERLGIEVHPDEHAMIQELTQQTNPVDIVDELERVVEEKVNPKDSEAKDDCSEERPPNEDHKVPSAA